MIEKGVVKESAKRVRFLENDFLFNGDRALEFIEKAHSSGLVDYFNFVSCQTSINTPFHGHDTSNGINTELVESLRMFKELGLGPDAFIPSESKRLGKFRYTLEHIKEVASYLKGLGIVQRHYVILSNADSTIEGVLKTCYIRGNR